MLPIVLKPGSEVPRGTPLHLAVSQAPVVKPVIVPDVTNRRVADALAVIDKVGLRRGNLEDRPAARTAGRGDRSVTEAGDRSTTRHAAAPRGVAGAGDPTGHRPGCDQPPRGGRSGDHRQSGLRRGNLEDRPAAGPPGLVLDQSLKPGTEVPRGTPLHLAVSQVPVIPPVIVPDVTNRPVAQALAVIDKVGLARGNIGDRTERRTAGRRARSNRWRRGRKCRGGRRSTSGCRRRRDVPLVVVPDVTNRPVAQALAVIDKVGLARGNIGDRTNAGPPGVVLDQSLAPGTEVPRGPRSTWRYRNPPMSRRPASRTLECRQPLPRRSSWFRP